MSEILRYVRLCQNTHRVRMAPHNPPPLISATSAMYEVYTKFVYLKEVEGKCICARSVVNVQHLLIIHTPVTKCDALILCHPHFCNRPFFYFITSPQFCDRPFFYCITGPHFCDISPFFCVSHTSVVDHLSTVSPTLL